MHELVNGGTMNIEMLRKSDYRTWFQIIQLRGVESKVLEYLSSHPDLAVTVRNDGLSAWSILMDSIDHVRSRTFLPFYFICTLVIHIFELFLF